MVAMYASRWLHHAIEWLQFMQPNDYSVYNQMVVVYYHWIVALHYHWMVIVHAIERLQYTIERV